MDRERLWLLLPRHLRALPADLAAVLALVVATNLAVFVPVVNETPLRVVVGLAFVLFVPGYAFVAALFPEAGEPPGAAADGHGDGADDPETPAETAAGALRDRGIDGIERVALAFGLSIAIVPLLGLVLNFTPFGIRLVPILLAVSGFTAVATAVAAVRRWELPAEERFVVPYREWLAAGKREALEPDTRLDAALNVLLVVSVLLAVSSVAYAVAVPPQGEQFTEFYLLTEDGDELVAAGYPETFAPGEPESLHVGISNNEYETVEYAVVVQLQRVEGEGNESVVTERAEVDRWAATVEHNETWLEEREVVLEDGPTGEELRLTFLLYDGEVPAEPTRENAYRSLHLWIEIESGE
jgi:uncharacterized membrane protein